MKKYNIKSSLWVLAILVIACNPKSSNDAKQYLPFYSDASFTPHWFSPDADELETFHRIPDFSLINQRGEIITQNTLKGKITVVDFFFTTCPGICPKMTDNMAVLQDSFIKNNKVVLLSHSVTPEYDSVPILAAFANNKGIISKNWHLLTGQRNTIYNLGRKAYFVEEDLGLTKSADAFLHTENFVLVDGNRHIRGIYNGLNKASVAQLIEDIRALELE